MPGITVCIVHRPDAPPYPPAAALSQICSQNHLCNSFMAFNSNYHDTGLFGVYAVADKDSHVEDLAWAIMQVCVHSGGGWSTLWTRTSVSPPL